MIEQSVKYTVVYARDFDRWLQQRGVDYSYSCRCPECNLLRFHGRLDWREHFFPLELIESHGISAVFIVVGRGMDYSALSGTPTLRLIRPSFNSTEPGPMAIPANRPLTDITSRQELGFIGLLPQVIQ